jgi:ATP-dependent exoDNAse (exonuclease V) beta subunit
MQSIYLFRDADVGLFLKAATEGFAGIELKRLKLVSNFRSLAGIVDWVNETFAPAFPEAEDISSGAVRYSASHGAVASDKEATLGVSIYAVRDNELEAKSIAQRIEAIRKVGGIDESIAILIRSRAHVELIVEEFKSRGIDFRTTNLDPLIECAVVQDLMSLMRAIMHPLDRVAWLSLLRAPWCGLSLTDIHALTQDCLSTPIYTLISSDKKEALSADGQERLKRLEEKLTKAVKLRGRVGLRMLLESLWVELGGPASLKEPGEMRAWSLTMSCFRGLVSVRALIRRSF